MHEKPSQTTNRRIKQRGKQKTHISRNIKCLAKLVKDWFWVITLHPHHTMVVVLTYHPAT
jgi:hypothetical protein